MVIAIDGPAGSGKSTTAKIVAKKLGYIHLNTGAMYRAIALKCIKSKIFPDDMSSLKKMLNDTMFSFGGIKSTTLFIDDNPINADIASLKVTKLVTKISTISFVREKLVKFQRDMVKGKNVVMEGRDIGTIVFPNADYKFFLIADIVTRAKRRKVQLEEQNEDVSIEKLVSDIKSRDISDESRKHSPLKQAKDAFVIDGTDLTLEDQVNCIIDKIKN